MTHQYENVSLSGCQILRQKLRKPSSNIKADLFTFSEPKYLKRLPQNYFFYKKTRILQGIFFGRFSYCLIQGFSMRKRSCVACLAHASRMLLLEKKNCSKPNFAGWLITCLCYRWLANSKVQFHSSWDCVRLRVVSIFPQG